MDSEATKRRAGGTTVDAEPAAAAEVALRQCQLALHAAQADNARLREQLQHHLDAGAAQQAQRDLQTRVEIAQLQQEIGALDLDLVSVMTVMAERARALTGAKGALVELVEGETLVCHACDGTSSELKGRRLPLRGSLSGLVVDRGETMWSGDLRSDARANSAQAHAVNVRSMIASPLRAQDQVIGILKVQSDQVDAFSPRDVAKLKILVETLGSTLHRYRIAEQLRMSEAQYRLAFDHNPQPMWVSAVADLRFLAVNRAFVEHYGYSESEMLTMKVSDLWLPEDRSAHAREVAGLPHDLTNSRFKRRHRRKDGSVIDVETSADSIDFDGQRARLVLASDVTQRLRAERELARVSRAQRMLSACNEALVRAPDEVILLQEICRITVDIGGYWQAYVGFVQDGEDRSIEWTAGPPDTLAFLNRMRLRGGDAVPLQLRGPSWQAIQHGRSVFVENLETCYPHQSFLQEWREQIRSPESQSLGVLPLKDKGRTFGLLNLLSREPLRVGADEIALLEELANNLAFGLCNLRAHRERQSFQEAALKVATAVSARTGAVFFEQLAGNMAEALQAQVGVVARFLPGEPLERAQTLAVVAGGQAQPNFAYCLEATQKASLAATDNAVIRSRAGERLEGMPLLAQFGAQACAWQRLDNSAGQPIGLLSVLFRAPLAQTSFISSILQIFAARAAAELERQESDIRIRDQAALLDKAQDAIVVRDMANRVLYWNKGAERLYGWGAQEALGRSMIGQLYQDESVFRAANASLLQNGEWSGEVAQRGKDGAALVVECRWTLLRDDEGRPKSVLAINTDITQRKSSEMQIQKLAFYDSLTGLPNRILLLDRLQQALAACLRSGRGGALLFIDLDNFKTLNDTSGHDKGDLLLQQVASRLVGCVREVDTVARFGGDEFVVVLESLGAGEEEVAVRVRGIGDKILSALDAPYELAGYEHRSTSSIGVAPFAGQHCSAGELLKQADLAMYQAKAAGRNTLRFFDPDMQATVSARAALEADLRQAIVQGEFLLYYQPQVDLRGDVLGVEALVRWRHPQRGMVSPAQFIPLAEDTGMIVALGQWVLEAACTALTAWQSQFGAAWLTVAVNVSPRQFHHPHFVEQVLTALDRSGADPRGLKLELTESLLVEDIDAVIGKMERLKARGVGFSLDDFGTGYSSLAYLKRLPLDQIKIDQGFVRDVLSDPNDAAIARTILALSHSLGLHAIAEGVEEAAQRDFLAQHGCSAFQGYLYGRPQPIEQISAFLRHKAGRPAA